MSRKKEPGSINKRRRKRGEQERKPRRRKKWLKEEKREDDKEMIKQSNNQQLNHEEKQRRKQTQDAMITMTKREETKCGIKGYNYLTYLGLVGFQRAAVMGRVGTLLKALKKEEEQEDPGALVLRDPSPQYVLFGNNRHDASKRRHYFKTFWKRFGKRSGGTRENNAKRRRGEKGMMIEKEKEEKENLRKMNNEEGPHQVQPVWWCGVMELGDDVVAFPGGGAEGTGYTGPPPRD
ncbi:hypothetical protein Pcinc_020162 [Petrolisthes cinctipes]|uniref:Uncharacterized protein n=1 Tax=Petrolisthes cinctipes TaxID=88211 RepID=A0AAE1KLQ3_PETCI|nr:hypothetical protein Pcinc_020162 [Petrolisthes cinctipes]